MYSIAIRWIRWAIYCIFAAIWLGILIDTVVTLPAGSLQYTQLAEWYGFAAIIFLYLTLLISPLYEVLPDLPFKPVIVKGRQALGISTFGFGLTHACYAFWGLLGGFAGLPYLDSSYIIAISLSLTALTILTLMAISDWPVIHLKLGRWWKRLHRLVYAAGVLIIIHLLILGSHFSDLSQLIPQIFLILLFFLLILETIRFDRFLSKRFPTWPKVGFVMVAGSAILVAIAVQLFLPGSTVPSLNIHAAHIQLAQQAQQTSLPFSGSQFANIPGLTGDRTKRYSVNFTHEPAIQPGIPTTFQFTVVDASNGDPVQLFETIYTKTSHLVIVDDQLQYFTHVHPTLSGSTFTMTMAFPHEGRYRLYLDFDPFGAIEQQFGFNLTVGTLTDAKATQPADTSMTKAFGAYTTTLNTHGALKAADLSIGRQLLTFTLTDSATHQPLTNLQPYLGAFGHLVMINEKTYDYLHVHPYVLATTPTGGPTVDFMPLGIYGPIKPGTYRLFAQFNPNGQLFVADYTVIIE